MPNTMLHDIFFGRILPRERGCCTDPEYTALNRKIEEERNFLKSRLSPEDAERLEELGELYTRAAGFENAYFFADGLRFGALLMMDVLRPDGRA